MSSIENRDENQSRGVSPQKKGNSAHRQGSKKAGKKKMTLRTLQAIGAVLSLLQAGTAALFIYLLNGTGMIPWKYIMTSFAVLAVSLLLVILFVNLRSRKTRIAAIVISVLLIAVQLVGSSYLYRTMNLLRSAESSYKTELLDFYVRNDDPAEEMKDVSEYRFGIVDDLSADEKKTLLETVRRKTGKEIAYWDYSTAIEAARALADGEIDVAVFREAYSPVLEEVMDSFASNSRVIDTCEIRTEMKFETVEPGEPFHLLISGIDVKGDISQTSRSDVNIIVTINPKTKKILMTTTPRDYYVYIPEVSGDMRDKLTHAGIYGEDASIRTLEQLYGIDITYYIRVNFTTLIDIVDAIDGVDVWSDYEFDCFTDHKVHIEKGWNHLNGRQALAFCRERFSFPDGDNQRGKDQEAVLKAIIEKVMSPALIVNASGLIDSMRGSFQTDLPESKIAELINQQLSEGTDWMIIRQAAESGPSGMEYTYSVGNSSRLSITWPDEYSVKKNAARMDMILTERPAEDGSAE
ncbi:MAG: LCP family protein [Eubacteriales bacterium]|nr:LCP family protein [Eubacteriales bacterium]